MKTWIAISRIEADTKEEASKIATGRLDPYPYEVGLVDVIEEPQLPPTEGDAETVRCANCGEFCFTIETIEGLSEVGEDGQFGGYTEVDWDSSTTVGYWCTRCDWGGRVDYWIPPKNAPKEGPPCS